MEVIAPQVQPTKNWYASKTIWIALLQLLGGFCAALVALLQTGDSMTFLLGLAAMGKSVLDIWARIKTFKAIA